MSGLIKRLISVIFLLFLTAVPAGAHDAAIPVVVDTDMALDDIRAITMLLNSGVAQVPVFVVSDGVRSTEEGAKNLRAMLDYFGMGSIRVVRGKDIDKPEPKVRQYIKEISVPGSSGIRVPERDKKNAPEVLVKTLKSADEPVVYLCIGPLTNLAGAMELDPEIKNSISSVVYYGAGPESNDPGWNTTRDMDAARKVFSSGLKIYSITLPENELLVLDVNLLEKIKGIGTKASGLIEKVHEPEDIQKLLERNHFYVWDEMAALFFNDSSIFKFAPSKKNPEIMNLTGIDREEMERVYLLSLGLHSDFHLSPRDSVIFTEIPKSPSFFREDVRPIVNRVIDVYGIEEWKACLLTNEFHRHLGIYSLIGAKMGVRAREVLEAPFDTLEVTSNAGNNPPLSCMNDGLQVSTGASLGRGTISVLENKSPSAVFVFNDISLTLSLKKEVWDRVKKDIRRLVEKHGGTNKAYFKDVRELSIRYWMDLDRYELFDEKLEKIIPGNK